MPKNYTENYQLNQWEPGDRVHHDDFNEDNRKIDAALAELQANQLRIHTGSYEGADEFEKTIPLPFRPKFFWLQKGGNADQRIMTFGDNPIIVHLWEGVSTAETNGTGVVVTVNDDNVHLRSITGNTDFERRQYAMNKRGNVYFYIALG